METLQKNVNSFRNHYSFVTKYTNEIPEVSGFFKLYNDLKAKIKGRKKFESIKPFLIYINGEMAYGVDLYQIEFVRSGFWLWKKFYIQTMEEVYDVISDQICKFQYKIVFEDKKYRQKFEENFKERKIHSLHLRWCQKNEYMIGD